MQDPIQFHWMIQWMMQDPIVMAGMRRKMVSKLLDSALRCTRLCIKSLLGMYQNSDLNSSLNCSKAHSC